MEKIRLLLYCCKEKKREDLLWSYDLKSFFLDGEYNRLIDDLPNYLLNGKIVAECDFEVEKIYAGNIDNQFDITSEEYKNIISNDIKERLQPRFFGGLIGYAIHIKNLNIFVKPRELEWNYHISYYDKQLQMQREKFLMKAPQNMCKVFTHENDYILISIRPEYLVKILNGEKTIEVRKKVLKEMITDA